MIFFSDLNVESSNFWVVFGECVGAHDGLGLAIGYW